MKNLRWSLFAFISFAILGCGGITEQGIYFWKRTGPVAPIVNPDGPLAKDNLMLLVLHDPNKDTKLPATQLDLLTSKNWRDFWKNNCLKDTDGNPEYRYVDGTSDGLSKLSGQWKTMVDANPPKSLPWIIAVNGKTMMSIPVPVDWTNEFRDQMDRIAGVK